jgi:hypothetical protein
VALRLASVQLSKGLEVLLISALAGISLHQLVLSHVLLRDHAITGERLLLAHQRTELPLAATPGDDSAALLYS